MKVYLITEEQIMGLYAAMTAGSRDFERVIEEVKGQEVKGAEAILALMRIKR